MKRTMKIPKLFAVFAVMVLALAVNVYAQNISSDFVRISAVTLERDFYMCDHEVTQKEYQDIMGTNPSKFKTNPDKGEIQENRPVERVSWFDAIEYCNKRSIKEGLTPCYKANDSTDTSKWGIETTADTGKWGRKPTVTIRKEYNYTRSTSTWFDVECDWNANGYRLPTNLEWEYAASGGNNLDKDVYSGTDDESKLGDYAWYIRNSRNKTHEVKKKKPNAFGLYDMSGNVEEWCWGNEGCDYASNLHGGYWGVKNGRYWKVGNGKNGITDLHIVDPGWTVPEQFYVLDIDYELPYKYATACFGFRVVRTDTSTVTEAHKKQVANQKESERKVLEEEQKPQPRRRSMEEATLDMAKSYLLNGIPPKKVAKIMGMKLSQVKELQKSIKK
ncbi:formylglycine-generating enzyme family protein [uncultured Treponema sp.]|uniref:formylglycine-generating enzyme family protein n=1 Tax=uncultured Treponema sp. TaxID=162155 RepID=UPI002584303A|nr:formylglycine-generating enzyme family protein [uncultured Treponema sp.]